MKTDLDILSDQKLYHLCKFYGEQAKKWRYQFMGLLPEVYKRKLYEKNGCSSVFEFAKKLAGLTEEQVRRVLNLEKSFEDKPVLKALLVTGEVSVNKLARIASIATPENERVLAKQVKLLPQKALETLVRDERENCEREAKINNQNALLGPLFEGKSVRTHRFETEHRSQVSQVSADEIGQGADNIATLLAQLKFSMEPLKKLLELQQKGIDVNELILEMLKKRELEIAQEKEQISAQLPQTNSRHIPAKIKKLIQKEHGNKCSIKTCNKASEHIHHTQRFSLTHVHDPHYLAPLCKNHHIIAHSIDLKFQEKRSVSG